MDLAHIWNTLSIYYFLVQLKSTQKLIQKHYVTKVKAYLTFAHGCLAILLKLLCVKTFHRHNPFTQVTHTEEKKNKICAHIHQLGIVNLISATGIGCLDQWHTSPWPVTEQIWTSHPQVIRINMSTTAWIVTGLTIHPGTICWVWPTDWLLTGYQSLSCLEAWQHTDISGLLSLWVMYRKRNKFLRNTCGLSPGRNGSQLSVRQRANWQRDCLPVI